MRRIRKGSAPAVLAPLAADPDANWDSVDGATKLALRAALFADQHGLCAYCLSRLNNPTKHEDPRPKAGGMKVEHFAARNERGIDEAESHRRCFDWQNLLGVCPGGEDVQRREVVDKKFCEAARGNVALSFNPASFPPDVSALLRSTDRGELRPAPDLNESDRVKLNAQIKTLHLDAPWLQENRRRAIDAARKKLQSQGFKRQTLHALRDAVTTPKDGLLPEQCLWVEHYLQKKLRQLPPR
jgi:uncharacterized protein (TIGR02646 family)